MNILKHFISHPFYKSSNVWEIYTTLIRDRIITDLESPCGAISQHIVSAFEILCEFITPEDMNHILNAVLTALNPDVHQSFLENKILNLIFTADIKSVSSANIRSITTTSFQRLLSLANNTEYSDELFTVFESLIFGFAVPKSIILSASYKSMKTMKISRPISFSSNMASLISPETLERMILRPDKCINAIAALVMSDENYRRWVLQNISLISDNKSALKHIFIALIMALTVPDENGNLVRWTREISDPCKSIILHEILPQSGLFEVLCERIIYGLDKPNESYILNYETLVMNRVIFMKALDKDSELHFHSLADKIEFIEKGQDINYGNSVMWASRYLNVLLSYSKIYSSDHIIGFVDTLILNLSIIRGFYKSRKKIDFSSDTFVDDIRENQVQSIIFNVRDFFSSLDTESMNRVGLCMINHRNPNVVKSFIVSALKYRFTDPNAMEFLNTIISLIYKDKVNISIYFKLFINSILFIEYADSIPRT